MSENTRQIAEYKPQSQTPSVFSGVDAFESGQRMAKALAESDLTPNQFRKNISNCLIAVEVAQRTGSSVLAVMQNLHVIQGKPSWSSQYVIAALNSCGRFSPLRFEIKDLGEKTLEYTYWEGEKPNRQKKTGKITIRNLSCTARAIDDSGETLFGPEVTIEMAVREGWYTKNDSKWPTMTRLMLMYRAAAFFGRLYAPEVLMGMQSDDEIRDVSPAQESSPAPQGASRVEEINKKVKSKRPAPTIEAEAVQVLETSPEESVSVSEETTKQPEQDFF